MKAVFAGSFDPPTLGHINIIERTHKMFSRIYMVIAENSEKQCLFSTEERKAFLEDAVKDYPNVEVHIWPDLVVDFATSVDATILIRGIRNFTDFSYEFDLSVLNRSLNSSIETIFIPTDPKYFVLRSANIKDLSKRGFDVSSMVPSAVAVALKEKYGGAK